MRPALPVVRVTSLGRNAGKTRLAALMVARFRERGFRVAAVKRSHHPMQPDVPGKDTELFAAAGADPVVFVGPDGTLERRFTGREPLDAVVVRLTGSVDLVIAEGFKGDILGAELRLSGPPPAEATLTSMDGKELLSGVSADEVERIVATLEQEFCMSAAGDDALNDAIRRASALHGHFCPGIILGVRMSSAASAALGVPLPDYHRKLSVTVESARCFADAISATTGCSAGRQNFIIDERGATVAAFENRDTGRRTRISVLDSSKTTARKWSPEAASSRHAQAVAYRLMPDEALLEVLAD